MLLSTSLFGCITSRNISDNLAMPTSTFSLSTLLKFNRKQLVALRPSVKKGSPGINVTPESMAFDNNDCVSIIDVDFSVSQKNRPPTGKFHIAKSPKYLLNTVLNMSRLSFYSICSCSSRFTADESFNIR